MVEGATLNPHHWPSNPDSPKVDATTDWSSVNFDTIRAVTPQIIRKIPLPLLGQLNSRYEQLWQLMPKPCQDLGLALLEGRATVKKEPVHAAGKKEKPKSDRDVLLTMIEGVEDLAADDPSVLLKSIEVRAKLLALLNARPAEVDPTVTINIVTGIVRD